MTSHGSRPKFWSSIFHKQPIEKGVYDPIDEDLGRVRAGFDQASTNLTNSVKALLDDLERQKNRQQRGSNV